MLTISEFETSLRDILELNAPVESHHPVPING